MRKRESGPKINFVSPPFSFSAALQMSSWHCTALHCTAEISCRPSCNKFSWMDGNSLRSIETRCSLLSSHKFKRTALAPILLISNIGIQKNKKGKSDEQQSPGHSLLNTFPLFPFLLANYFERASTCHLPLATAQLSFLVVGSLKIKVIITRRRRRRMMKRKGLKFIELPFLALLFTLHSA